MDKCKLSPNRLIGISTDGASVMIGKNEGVVARLKRCLGDHMISTHYAAHRLALACSRAGDDVYTLESLDRVLMNIYKTFKHSFPHKKVLEAVQSKRGLSIKKYIDSRWFSRFEVIESVDDN